MGRAVERCRHRLRDGPSGRTPPTPRRSAQFDYLSDQEFPVQDVTIVGVNLMQVERVLGRLTWAKVIGGGIVSGAWLGVFFGLVLGIVTGGFLAPLIAGIVGGIIFGVISTTIPYAATRGQRTSPRRCSWSPDVTTYCVSPRRAESARDLLAKLAI